MKSAETSAISAGETHEVLEVREKGSLDRATIVKTALRLLDDVGIDGLSTRRLATELGIKSASLYWHFKDKDELLNEMSTVMLKECLHLGNANEPGFDAIKWLADSARAIRSTALSRRDGAQVMARLERWWNHGQGHDFDRELDTYFGKLSLHRLLERSTWHPAQHARQLISVLETFGITPAMQLTPALLQGLPLPERLWE